MKCYRGNILTVNDQNEVCKYLVEDGGKIVFVGNTLPETFQNAEVYDLHKKALIPAFVDTHQHFASFATFQAGLNVMDAESNLEIKERIREYRSKMSAKTLIVFGASPYSVKEKRLISKDELDEVCPDCEIMVVKYDGHACIINTKLWKRLKKDLEKLRGYHPDTGEMNQEAFYVVSNDITNSISPINLFKNMQESVDFQASYGIGCIHTVSGVGFTGNLDITMEKIFAKGMKNGFQLRVFPQSMDIRVATKRKLPRIGGCFACALDGCFGSHDASLKEDYADEIGGNGVLYYDDQKVMDFCKAANRAGLQIELHAIGDRAFEQACHAIKAALDDFPRENHRHGIIHDCLPTEGGIEICQRYHIMLLAQSAFINWKQEPDEYLIKILGSERWKRLNPINTYQKHHLMVSFGSDAPCTSPNPIMWMDHAVNNNNTAEAVSIQDALRMCTYNGYYASFDENDRGSLEVGKIADMVILSQNPYEIPLQKIKDIKVEQLYLAGEKYKSCKSGVMAQIMRGLVSNGNC